MRKASAKKPAAKKTTAANATPEATATAAAPATKTTAAKRPAAKKPAARATAKKPAAKAASRPAAKAKARPAAAKARPTAAKAKTRTATAKRTRPAPAAKRTVRAGRNSKPATARRKTTKRSSAVDAMSLVADALTSMKAVEKTARRLLTEIKKRDSEIAKLRNSLVDVNGRLKRERQASKRQERSAERALLRAHATVKRHAIKAAEASKAEPKTVRVTKFSHALAKHPKKSPSLQTSNGKHAAKHAKHKELAELGKQISSNLQQI